MITPASYRPLGASELRLSPLGLGTVKLGRNEGVRYPQAFELPDDASVLTLFAEAARLGINLLDTAPAYGLSETRIGQLLDRQVWDPLICTKVGEHFSAGQSTWNFSADAVRSSVTDSLKKLRRKQLDIVLVHCPDDDLEVLQNSPVIEVLRDFQSKGIIKAIGASTKTVEAGLFVVSEMDVVMVAFNQQDQSQLPVIHAAQQNNKGVMLKKIL
ncbi:MAG: aldo/keto reductase, partial [Pseudomonadales bacterium]|nr:aldo/keto reductase [Pseudomonadales bacterium]